MSDPMNGHSYRKDRTFLDTIILQDPATQKTLAKHKREQKLCVYCRTGAYHTVVMYYDPAILVSGQQVLITFHNVCTACLARPDFDVIAAAEYSRDIPKARATMARQACAVWN